MARPRKQTVDYFPHYCDHKKTMFVLEQRYGNNGYAFWFKLLELLGKTEGHFLDVNNSADWEYLTSYTKLDPEICTEILDLLSRLAAIDEELWEDKIIWSQNFVDGIADVYKNRRVETPARPDNYRQKPHTGVVSTDRNPQSIVEETKKKVEETTPEGNVTVSIPIDEVLEYYNTHRGNMPEAVKTTEQRKSAVKGRIKDYSLEDIYTVIDKALASNFLQGENENAWTANLDWLLKPSSFIKVLEGNYDNREKKEKMPLVYQRLMEMEGENEST